jgi:apolipoprotein N-acyltransferase
LRSRGDVTGRYDKRHLVPFGEYVPLKSLLAFVEVLGGGAIGELRSGREATIFSTPLGRLAVVICYEAIFPAEVRDFFLAGADVLVNITNDAWFGRSAAPVQDLAMAAFRAVENRAYLIRAANTGISAIVAPDGRIVEASGLFTRETVSGTIAPRVGPSVYTRYGDVFAWATVAVALAVMWPSSSTRRIGMRRMGSPGSAGGGDGRDRGSGVGMASAYCRWRRVSGRRAVDHSRRGGEIRRDTSRPGREGSTRRRRPDARGLLAP